MNHNEPTLYGHSLANNMGRFFLCKWCQHHTVTRIYNSKIIQVSPNQGSKETRSPFIHGNLTQPCRTYLSVVHLLTYPWRTYLSILNLYPVWTYLSIRTLLNHVELYLSMTNSLHVHIMNIWYTSTWPFEKAAYNIDGFSSTEGCPGFFAWTYKAWAWIPND